MLIVLGLYQFGNKGDVSSFMASRPGFLCAAGLLGLSASARLIMKQLQSGRLAQLKKIGIIYLVVVVLTVVPAEMVLRAVSLENQGWTMLGKFKLYPRRWSTLAEGYSRVLDEARQKSTYFVYDSRLGWTIGPNRRSQDGLYFSNVEGIRSAAIETALADRSSSYRIALLGDSYMFGEEVPFESSLGHQLGATLGPEFQVLNFGVPGYGVDQMILRYEKDVPAWNPDMVILGFIDDDITRSMMVYPFIGRPDWLMPWSKPRFISQGDDLALLNVPTIPPEEIFSARNVHELPFIGYDQYYCRCDWDRSYWKLFHRSYLFRSVISLSPRWEMPRDEISITSRRAIHRKLFRSFVDKVKSAGSVPLIVLLPVSDNYGTEAKHRESADILSEAGISYVDLTSCLENVQPRERFVRPEGGHYSLKGNQAIAQCIGETVVKTVPSFSSRPTTRS